MPIVGFIELHAEDKGIGGWCVEVDADGSPKGKVPELSLYAGDVFIRRIDPFQKRPDVGVKYGYELAGFRLMLLRPVIEALPEGTLLEVRDRDGTRLPFVEGFDAKPVGRATDGGEALLARFDRGEVVDKWGSFKTPFSAKPELRESYMDALEFYVDYFFGRYGLVVTPTYGTLLGLARSQSFLDHDDDVDLSLMFPGTDVTTVAARFWSVLRQLRDDGFNIFPGNTGQMHIGNPSEPSLPLIDVFASWQTLDNWYFTYFAVGGQLDAPIVYVKRVLEGRTITVPEPFERILEFMYGPNWLLPDKNFQWVVPGEVRTTMAKLEAAGKADKLSFGAD